jgi:outer membrane lipoprotein SlyB
MAPAPAPNVVTESGVVLPSQPLPAPAAQAVCAHCGRIEAVTPIQRKGQAQGVGAVTGGVLGAVVGNQIGKGSGRTLATVLGAVGGGVAGNAIEKNMAMTTVYLVQIRMEDGSVRSIEQSSAPPVGAAVIVDDQSLRSADGGRIVSTSAAATRQPTTPQGKVYSTERN